MSFSLALQKYIIGLACLLFAAPLSTLEATASIVDMWSLSLGAVGAAIAGIILANTDLFLTKPEFATLKYLENADLKTTEGGEWDYFIERNEPIFHISEGQRYVNL